MPRLLVLLELGGLCASARLLAPDARDPGVDAGERSLQRVDLGGAAAALERPGLIGTPGVEDLDLDAKAVLELLPGASVSGKRTPVSIVNTRDPARLAISMWTRTDSSFWKEQAIVSRGWKRSTA